MNDNPEWFKNLKPSDAVFAFGRTFEKAHVLRITPGGIVVLDSGDRFRGPNNRLGESPWDASKNLYPFSEANEARWLLRQRRLSMHKIVEKLPDLVLKMTNEQLDKLEPLTELIAEVK
jgi:hypothetical protein